MLITLDEKIMAVFQQLTNFLNDMFGIENFQIAKLFLMMSAIAEIFEFGVSYYVTKDFFSFPLILLILFGYKITWDTIKEAEGLNPDTSTIHPIILILKLYRYYILIFIVLGLPFFLFEYFAPVRPKYLEKIFNSGLGNYYVFARVGSELEYFISVYFASCIRPPRKTSKVREFISGLTKKRKIALSSIKAL